MSLNAVNNLNLIYLYYSNRFQDEINNFNYFDYDLDNTLLGSYEKKKISRLDDYNLFMQSINGTHGLAETQKRHNTELTDQTHQNPFGHFDHTIEVIKTHGSSHPKHDHL